MEINENNTIINNPHDNFFRLSFQKKKIAMAFLKGRLKPELLDVIDLNTLELQNTSFIDEQLKSSYADVLYRVDAKCGEGCIYFLIEHQSQPDKKMVGRLWRYMARVWDYHVDQGHEYMPIVQPIVLYTGTKPYNYATSLIQGFQHPNIVWNTLADNFLINVNAENQTKILKDGDAALIEIVLRDKNVDAITKDAKTKKMIEEEADLFTPLCLYVADQSNYTIKETIKKLINLNPKKEKEVMNALARLEQRGIEMGIIKGREEGREEGIEMGIIKGREEGKRTTIELMINEGVISRKQGKQMLKQKI